MTVLVLTVSVSFGLSMLIVWFRLRFSRCGLDVPGERSLHDRPTPHGGGLGVIVVVLMAGLGFDIAPVFIAGVAVLAVLSAIDDRRNLPFWLRLIVHIAVATSVVFLHSSDAWILQILLLMLIAWFINAYNFMDGADGLAGSMAVIGFGAYALGFGVAGQAAYAYFCASIAAGALGFLRFNWNPARIFMGDLGSIPLGFLAGALGWTGVVSGAWSWWFPLMVFWPFVFDASVTLIRRVCRREKVWQAHREHYYQRMVRMAGSHSAVVRAWIVMMLFGAGLAVASQVFLDELGWRAFAMWSAAVAVCAIWVDRRWNRQQ